MGRLAEWFRSFWLEEKPSRDPALAAYFGLSPISSGVTVNDWTALNYSAFWAAVRVIAEPVGSLPLFLYKRLPGGGRERFTTHRLHRILHDEFNPEMTALVARETMQAHVLTWGNAYAEIERNGNLEPIALWPITPDRVTPDRPVKNGPVVYRVKRAGGGPDVIVPAEDMLHIAGPGFDGLMGYSIVRRARESIGLGLATEKFGATFFGNGAWFGGFLQHPGKLSDIAKANIENSTNVKHQGPDQAHKLKVLEEGMKYEKIGIPPDDAQFLQTRQFQVVEMARWFNLPVHKLREMENSSVRANIEQEAIDFVTASLRPWLVRWEQECNRKLIRPLERTIQYVEHNVDGLLRGDLPSRYAAYAIGRQWGWLSPDDIRELENLNPLPNGQGRVYLVPSNMVPADRIDDVIDAQTAPPSVPAPREEPPPDRSAVIEAKVIEAVTTFRAGLDEFQARLLADLKASLPVPALPPAPEEPKPRPAVAAQVIAAQRAMFADCVGRMVRKETNAARRAAHKGPEHFREWMVVFYAKHEDTFTSALVPAMQAHVSHVGNGKDPAAEARTLAGQYIEESRAELTHVVESQPPDLEDAIDALVSQWELERPQQLADAVMAEELTHALRSPVSEGFGQPIVVNVSPPAVTIAEGAVRVTVDNHPATVNVAPAAVTIAEGAVQVPVTVEAAQPAEVHVEAPITVQPAEVTIAEGAVQIHSPVTVEPAQPAEVHVDARTTVERGAVQAPVTVKTPDPRPMTIRKKVDKRDASGRPDEVTEIHTPKVE